MILPFYKPKGISSYDVIRILKHQFKGEKIGHGGTLDPMAEGVLVIGIGRAGTKSLHNALLNSEKEYLATIILGKSSTTFDAEGEITENTVFKIPDYNTVRICINKFKGEISQVPPVYSAIKISGKPAYSYARKNQEIVIQPKNVSLFEFEILRYEYPILEIKMNVSSGFYIRSFAHDLGKLLKTGGYLSVLKRLKVGKFTAQKSSCLTKNSIVKLAKYKKIKKY